MKVTWDAIDVHTWDAHHARMGAALQQDWAYGACMKALGVHVLRGWVTRDDEPVALAQFIVRYFGAVLIRPSVARTRNRRRKKISLPSLEKNDSLECIARSALYACRRERR